MPSDFSRLLAHFAAGAALWAFRNRVRPNGSLAILAVGVLLALAAVGHVDDVGSLPLAYLVLWAGARLPVRLGQRTDLSYGLYVYGLPVQTLLSLAGRKALGPLGFGAMAVLVAGGFAALSWRFVEAPSLGLRSRLAREIDPLVRCAVEAPASKGSR